MKKAIQFLTLCILAGLWACEDVETLKPEPATEASDYSASFLLVNATPDAPNLDLYINNVKTGTFVSAGETQAGYTTVGITSNAVIANTNIRSSAETGTIGGTLGSSNLIYRATSTSSNNFTASNGASYTVFVVDSVNRPQPMRTLNAANAGDITYFSYRDSFTAAKKVGVGDTTIHLNVKTFGVDDESLPMYASNNSIVAFNLVKKYNGNVNPTFMTAIGVVPLGSTDAGGVRYYIAQDIFAAFANATDSTTKAGFRVVNASPGAPSLYVRLKFVSGTGTDINLPVVGSSPASFAYVSVMNNVSGGLQPSVGSRTVTSTTATFQAQTVAPAGTPNVYNVEVSTNSTFTQIITPATLSDVTFGGSTNTASNYTILISGFVNGTGSETLKLTIVEHTKL